MRISLSVASGLLFFLVAVTQVFGASVACTDCKDPEFCSDDSGQIHAVRQKDTKLYWQDVDSITGVFSTPVIYNVNPMNQSTIKNGPECTTVAGRAVGFATEENGRGRPLNLVAYDASGVTRLGFPGLVHGLGALGSCPELRFSTVPYGGGNEGAYVGGDVVTIPNGDGLRFWDCERIARVIGGVVHEINVVTAEVMPLIATPMKAPFPFQARGVDWMVGKNDRSILAYRGAPWMLMRIITSPRTDMPWPYSTEGFEGPSGQAMIVTIWQPRSAKSAAEPNVVAIHDVETGETWIPIDGQPSSCEDPEAYTQDNGQVRVFCADGGNIWTESVTVE